MDRGPVALLLLCCACAPPKALPLVDALPAEVAWVAALAINGDGAIVASTGLVRRGPPAKLFLDLPAEAETIEVLGFDDAAIAFVLTRASEAELRAGLITAAGALEPHLPETIVALVHETSGAP